MTAKKTKKKPKSRRNEENSKSTNIRHLIAMLQRVQSENELLKQELSKSKQIPSGKIGFTLLIIGVLSLLGSLITSSTTLAFIGLGLTFWGALFLFTRPIKFVRGSLLDWTAISSYATIERMLEDLNYKGKGIYVPPYPKDVYLPQHLKGLKEMIVFISAMGVSEMPTIEEMARKEFLVKNPKGVCISPPGYGLMSLFEKEMRTDFSHIAIENLYDILPKVVDLGLAGELEIETENDSIHITIIDSIYKDLYSRERALKSVHIIGCPLVSAVACALAKTTGKNIVIVKDKVSPDLKKIEVWYQTIEG
jgi:hypothetical protein